MRQKYYLVSGAGTGIGLAIAKKLAERADHSVILCGRRQDVLNEALHQLSNIRNHSTMVLDLQNQDTIKKASDGLTLPYLDGIISNAGIGGENQFGDGDRWDAIIGTNLTGTYHFVNNFLPLLKKSPNTYRHVVIISSILARLGVARYSAYCASKAGLLGLMRSWAVELAPEKILVNAICPGWVNTKMAQDGMEGIAKNIGITTDAFFRMAMESVPLRKMSEPEEIADLTHYLVKQSSITGQALDINNGAIMNS